MEKIINFCRKLSPKPFRAGFKKLYQRYKISNQDRIVTAVRDGIKYKLNLNELIDSSIYYEGCFELKTTSLINKFVKDGMTVLDIGANIGCHTLRFAKLVGKNGKVVAFEPMTFALTKLKDNIELNNFKNIIVEKIALSNVDGKRQTINFRASWTLDGNREDINQKEEIDFLTLDTYIRKKQINKVDFVKVDVDGYEYKVLVGAKETLQKFSPLILIELGKYTLSNFGDKLEDLVDFLYSLGYSFYSEENFKEYKDKKTLLDSIPPEQTINVLCKPT